MGVGVPETDVFAAADRVLARGERPTVERVRIELGRGSPARVGQTRTPYMHLRAARNWRRTLMPCKRVSPTKPRSWSLVNRVVLHW